MTLSRRTFLGLSIGLPGALSFGCAEGDEGDGWDRGPLRHLLATASESAFVVKASLVEPSGPPLALRIGDREVAGERTDSRGRFWSFRAGGLAPDTELRLQLWRAGAPVCGPWPLRTLPPRDASPKRLRVASFTCAGGPNLPTPPAIFHAFKPAAWRRALFDEILAHEPDLVIANGDHVYFDLPAVSRLDDSLTAKLLLPFLDGVNARFDPALPVLGSANETALTTVGDDQLASAYGVRFRSTPVFFVTDDHDYFINDDATPEGTTLPPSPFHAELRNALQRLYFPELIAGALPVEVPGRLEHPDVPVSTHFGEIRYGDLFEALVYDCGGHLSLGERAGLVPPAAEAWLLARTRDEQTRHLLHVPSHPMGWTAGKWREWYPDLLESTGSLVAPVGRDAAGNKFLWQEGWWRQHQAILSALGSQERRPPLMASGDLHALGAVRIERSGELDLSARPVHSILSGPVGVGEIGWPSRARGVASRIPRALEAEALLELDERNGFTLLDFDRERARVRVFGTPVEYVPPDALSPASALDLEIG